MPPLDVDFSYGKKGNTEQQINKSAEFRQAIYENFFTRRKDAQFELLNVLLLKSQITSFPPIFYTYRRLLFISIDEVYKIGYFFHYSIFPSIFRLTRILFKQFDKYQNISEFFCKLNCKLWRSTKLKFIEPHL
jgi:hypothetical protein